MRAKGYEIKGENFGEDARKYISFRPLTQDKFVRGSVRSLGKEYTKERIKERIEQKRERKVAIPKKDYASRKLVDTSEEKFENSPGLKRWAAIENLKIAGGTFIFQQSNTRLAANRGQRGRCPSRDRFTPFSCVLRKHRTGALFFPQY